MTPGGFPRRFVIAFALVVGAAAGLDAQWLKVTVPDTPRHPDGAPNLKAPAPRTPGGTPDLSGVWRAANNRYIQDLGADLKDGVPFRPQAAAIYKERLDNNGLDRPSGKCLPKGVPEGMTIRGYPFKIVQTPKLTLVLYEIFVAYRQIHTDGRDFRGFATDPAEIHPAWLGYSVGRWDGDTFVVDTIGVNDRTWLDDSANGPGRLASDQRTRVAASTEPNHSLMRCAASASCENSAALNARRGAPSSASGSVEGSSRTADSLMRVSRV